MSGIPSVDIRQVSLHKLMLGNVCPGQPPLLSDQGESNLTQEILINPDANTDTTKSV